MRFLNVLAFILMLIILSVTKPPMNYSFDILTSSQAVDLLLNQQSSSYPGASILNYILYGSANDGYNYTEFLNSYGFKVAKPRVGDLIIGKDGALGGILDYYGKIIVPSPDSKIQEIPKAVLSIYFPNGYLYKSAVLGDYTNLAYTALLYK